MSDNILKLRLVFPLHVRISIFKVLLSALLLNTLIGSVSAQQNQATQIGTARIVWTRQPGVSNYRLQIATDSRFNDVVFDRRVSGNEYVVREVPIGRYYWRVASAETQTGVFQSAVPFEVKVEAVPKPTANPTPTQPRSVDTSVRTRRTLPGWSAATGDVAKLLSARLIPGAAPDFIGVNSDGTVYALQGSSGIALWTAHFHLNSSGAKRVRDHYQQFMPLVMNIGGTSPAVIVAFDEGARALDGATGREIWNTKMAGRAFVATTMERLSASPFILLVGERTNKLLILDASNGQLINQITTHHEIVEAPVVLGVGADAEVLVPVKGGLLELHTLDGRYLRSIKVATEITTQLQVVSTARGKFVLAGLKNGLVAFDAMSLQGIGRIALEGDDYPVGALSLVDLNGDGTAEVVASTNAGRVIAIDVSDEKIRWTTEPGYSRGTCSFVDLDGDAKIDVVLPGAKSFAVALSGVNGRLIWQSEEENPPTSSSRAFAVAQLTEGRLVIVGSDQSAAGLRALEVNRVSAKVNQ